MASQTQKWVVVISETIGDETTSQVVTSEYDDLHQAEMARNLIQDMNPGSGWLIEACTVEEAAQIVTE